MDPLAISCQIPVINFSDKTLKPGSSKWDEVKLDVRKALEDYGCFEASFDKVSVELNKSVLEVMEELSELPIQTKERNVSSKPFRGYLRLGLYQQSFGIDDANVLDKANDFTQQLWPGHDGNKKISKTIHRFSELLSELDVMVRRMVMESFGIEKYLDEHLNSTNYMLRLMEYTAPLDADIEEPNLAVDSHTDANIMTIIHQCQVDGLEVKAKDGKWIKVKAAQDSFIVMAGDSFSALMNGRVIPANHRVVMKGKTRYSTGLFSIPKLEVIIDTPEELVDEEHPRIFKPYIYGEFIDFFKTEDALRAQSTLHAFAAL